jgi:hypothetical protein
MCVYVLHSEYVYVCVYVNMCLCVCTVFLSAKVERDHGLYVTPGSGHVWPPRDRRRGRGVYVKGDLILLF